MFQVSRPSDELRDYVKLKTSVLRYTVLPGGAPINLGPFTHVADIPDRRSGHSADTCYLVEPYIYQSLHALPHH